MSERVCGTCRWHDTEGYQKFYKSHIQFCDEAGFCRRQPPIPDITRLLSQPREDRDAVFLFALWPETEDTDWCGEWQARNEQSI